MIRHFLGLSLVVAGLASGCVAPVELETADESASASQSLAATPGALFVVGDTNLVAGDQALKNRLQTLGFAVTLRSGAAVTAADATGKIVLISESVTSADVNTKLRNVSVPVLSFEPSLFDDLGLVDPVATNYGTLATQTNVLLLGNVAAATGDVTVGVTSSAQTFGWGKPVASATRIAAVAGDASRSLIFAFERGSALSGMSAPARRAGWFATAAAPSAFNANGWSLFDGLMRWAKADLVACSANSDCPGSTCVSGICSTTCAAGFTFCAGRCVNLTSDASNCGACGNSCASGKICAQGTCSTSCTSNSDCPGTTCVSGVCGSTCAAGFTSCAGACVDLNSNAGNCGACGRACSAGRICQSGSCL
jgi:hypothetical protein